MKIIFFNGPPRSGKDTAANAMVRYMTVKDLAHVSPYKLSIATPLKKATHELYGITGKDHNYYEQQKDEPQSKLLGLTPREAYMSLAETYAKVLHDKSFFGKVFVTRLKEFDREVNVRATINQELVIFISDCGFIDEIIPIIAKAGKANCLLIRVGRSGYDFSKDSRGYLNGDTLGVKHDTIVNSKLKVFRDEVTDKCSKWLKSKIDFGTI